MVPELVVYAILYPERVRTAIPEQILQKKHLLQDYDICWMKVVGKSVRENCMGICSYRYCFQRKLDLFIRNQDTKIILHFHYKCLSYFQL